MSGLDFDHLLPDIDNGLKPMANNRIGLEIGAKGAGRPKGSPNKTTALLKDAILLAAEQAGGDAGLVGYLTQQAKDNPGPFLALLGKLLPLIGDKDAPLQTVVSWQL